MGLYKVFSVSAALLGLSTATALACPDINMNVGQNEVTLAPGFMPDPHVVAIRAGGSSNLQDCGYGIQGWVATQPDFVLHWSGNGNPLMFYVEGGNADTVLLVRNPSGTTWVNDDYMAGNLNPGVNLDGPRAPAGDYLVWIGTYNHDQSYPEIRLTVSETIR